MNLIGGLGKDLADRRVAEKSKFKTAIVGSREGLKQILCWKSVNRFDYPPDFLDANLSSNSVSRAISVCQI